MVNDGGPEQVALDLNTMVYPSDVSPDGHTLLVTLGTGLFASLGYLELAGDRTLKKYVEGSFHNRDGQFSPDGRWVAYQSNETGRFETYLRPFPGPGERIQISSGGGGQPRWGKRTSELFFIAGDQRLTSVPVTFSSSGAPKVGQPVPLFRAEFDVSFLTRQQYAVSPDSQRFLVNTVTDVSDPASVTLILNWKGAQ
jgi:Tol biopolymer transport system component